MISSVQQDNSLKVTSAKFTNASNGVGPMANSMGGSNGEEVQLQQPLDEAKFAGNETVNNGKKEEQDKQADKKKLNKDEVSTMTEALNDFMENLNCNLEFKFYDKLDQLSVKMVDKQTQEVIKEFPPEEVMKAMIKTKEWIGVFLDRNA